MMEKENKKAREDARRDYNETIRVSHISAPTSRTNRRQTLVKFVRKRDPRYKQYQANLEAQKKAAAAAAATQKASTSRSKPSDSFVEQDWQRVDKRNDADLDWALAEGEDLEEWECVVCNKTFRSEAAWNSHERSKKHLKEVEKLRLEMEEEDEELGLGEEEDGLGEDADGAVLEGDAGEEVHPPRTPSPTSTITESEFRSSRSTPAPLADDIGQVRESEQADKGPANDEIPGTPQSDTEEPSPAPIEPKEEKAEQPTKREKRKARQAKKEAEAAKVENTVSLASSGKQVKVLTLIPAPVQRLLGDLSKSD